MSWNHPLVALPTALVLAAAPVSAGCGGSADQPNDATSAAGPEDSGGETVASGGAPETLRVGGSGVDFISTKIREGHRRLDGAPVPATDVLRARLGTSESSEHPVSLEGSRCYHALGVGVPSVRNLEMSLVDEFGHTQARDEVDDAFPSLRACPPVDAGWTLVLRVFEGYGPVGAQLFVE